MIFKKIKDEFSCIFERDPAAQSYFEIFTIYPGVHAILMHRISHKLWKLNFHWLARFNAHVSRFLTGIEIHPGAEIGHRLFIDHGMGVVIGETAVIGDDCTLYHGVTLGGTSWQKGKRHPSLGNGVVIGAGAKILGPIEIGDGARIGSNSVVLKSVPAGATVVGIPAHMVNPNRQEKEAQRLSIACQLGFDAYGMSPDMPDPIAHAINHMLAHIKQLDGQIEILKQSLRNNGITIEDAQLTELSNCLIDPEDPEAKKQN